MKEARRLSPGRSLLFTVIITGITLWSLNSAIQWAEQAGLVDTHAQDDGVALVEAPLFELEGDRVRTTDYAENSLGSSSFRAEKGDALRIFVLGGSFAMGSPYIQLPSLDSMPVASASLETGIPGWLQARLGEQQPERTIEVINAAAGGQNSSRVKDIANQVLGYQPDALIVCTGNNEGSLDPSRIREQLHRLGGYRLLNKILAGKPSPQRPWFTPQDPDTAAVRDQFRANLEDIAEASTAAGVPLLLCTLPINLSYIGLEPGHVLTGRQWPHLSGSCYRGIEFFDRGSYEQALPLLQECAQQAESSQPPPLPALLAMVELELNQANEDTFLTLEGIRGPCVTNGIRSYYAQDYRDAINNLEACDEVDEALLWLGLSHLKLGEPQRARTLLRQHVELVPRNRIRPSFNQIIRQVAADHDLVHLVDLEQAAQRRSPAGVPGRNLFLDYCHMHWKGYAAMAEEVLKVLTNKGLSKAQTAP